MGQAKQRGTYEERKAQALARRDAATTSESAEPKAKAERAAEDRADNPERARRSASRGGGMSAPRKRKSLLLMAGLAAAILGPAARG